MKQIAVGLVGALLLASTPLAGADETNRRDFHYRTRGMVRLLLFWIGKDDVGGGRISLLETHGDRDTRWTDGIELVIGSRPDRVPGGHNRWGYAKELAFWQGGNGSNHRTLDGIRFEGFMTLAHEESLDEVEKADKSLPMYEGTLSIVGSSGAEATLWRFRGSPGETYQNPEEALDRSIAIRTSEPYLERTLVNQNTYLEPYGFLTAVRAFVQEALNAEGSDSVLSAVEGEKPYVHNARPYALYLEKAKLLNNLELSGKRRHERVLELQMKTKNGETGKTHQFTLFMSTKGKLRGIPLRIEDKPRWWLKVRLDLDEEHRPSNEVIEPNS